MGWFRLVLHGCNGLAGMLMKYLLGYAIQRNVLAYMYKNDTTTKHQLWAKKELLNSDYAEGTFQQVCCSVAFLSNATARTISLIFAFASFRYRNYRPLQRLVPSRQQYGTTAMRRLSTRPPQRASRRRRAVRALRQSRFRKGLCRV